MDAGLVDAGTNVITRWTATFELPRLGLQSPSLANGARGSRGPARAELQALAVAPTAASRSAMSAETSASDSASRSPSRTIGRLCEVKLMRWSVTRLWGKL